MAETLREWEPLTSLFSQLPTRAQHGIFSFDIKLTCVDILPEHIALGTNFGLVYWYDRKKKDIQKLRCEVSTTKFCRFGLCAVVMAFICAVEKNGDYYTPLLDFFFQKFGIDVYTVDSPANLK